MARAVTTILFAAADWADPRLAEDMASAALQESLGISGAAETALAAAISSGIVLARHAAGDRQQNTQVKGFTERGVNVTGKFLARFLQPIYGR